MKHRAFNERFTKQVANKGGLIKTTAELAALLETENYYSGKKSVFLTGLVQGVKDRLRAFCHWGGREPRKLSWGTS